MLVLVLAIVAVAVFLSGLRLAFPPPVPASSATTAHPPATTGALAGGLEEQVAAHPGLTGILPLPDGMDAFVARLALVRAAASSIDARYYVWQRDKTGLVLMKAVLDAADRGVKVRLLVDDAGTPDFDAELAAFACHDNIEVRIFNPFMLRWPRVLNYAFDFFRLNRRMHNKSLLVDGRAAIVGGRNIGDEYFAAGDSLFIDLDVLAVGEVVPAVSRDFDAYWASASAIPAERIIPHRKASTAVLEKEAEEVRLSPEFAEYCDALDESGLVRRLGAGEDLFRWTRADLHSDDPAKGRGRVPEDRLLIRCLFREIGEPSGRFNLVSPYFIPGKDGAATFSGWARKGIAVSVLTNALETTDVVAVHAGYTKYRKPLLRDGLALFELRRGAGAPGGRDRLGLVGSSASSLHAKTFTVDGERIFVGSFNFDPRSALLNCEMGLVIDDAELAGELDRSFATAVPEAAWAMSLDRDGHLVWRGRKGDETVTRHDEPGGSLLRSVLLTVIGWLPVEWLL
ncbi:phospholipase [Zhengella mangrovi]|uniref:Phospholipase D n=1 Tax=Zhengella mangrovi TaxID=1982044 RepID=A0A2G1QI65_9HYPH|nr:phospholipase D family protein [Zhengella mangrovi]PHP65150.1 phospholipase [Zhengella mangrovi]